MGQRKKITREIKYLEIKRKTEPFTGQRDAVKTETEAYRWNMYIKEENCVKSATLTSYLEGEAPRKGTLNPQSQ